MSLPEPTPAVRSFLEKCLPESAGEFTARMALLGEFLYETNACFNLTAIREDGFWCRHVADSLSVVPVFPELFRSPSVLCDLGCGAGFPSLVLAAAFPGIRMTAVDSTRKKIDFVNAAARKLALENLTGIHGRGNELGRREPFKGAYDAVLARAVSSAETLIREGLAFVKKNGSLIVYRTPDQFSEELPFLKNWKKGSFHGTDPFELPDGAGTRMFLQIKQMREMH
ncbi:MAG: Ribosomal RNA small subunit methyltransferase G [Lentisphaerae bacterium ADurb.Bin242]|nr:MAG: Ribosomal RNA small subunit methyltransferase G [Lentisphaerae bacterium ADurb.Bin242]